MQNRPLMWVWRRPPLLAHRLTQFIYDLQSAVGGSTNVLRQAINAGIKRFSVASSVAAAMHFTEGVTQESLTEDGKTIAGFGWGPRLWLTLQPDRLELRDAGTSPRERQCVLHLLRLQGFGREGRQRNRGGTP